jgi:hypothetical protein
MAPNMNSYVTLSCLHGAIATAHWWGYSYRGTPAQTDMFEAAMHMKRASYCGDDAFYTRRNVVIMMRDEVGNLGNDAIRPLEFEASWDRAWLPDGPIRATCINRLKRRRPGALYPPNPNFGVDFDGTCDGNPLPDCSPDETLYPPLLVNPNDPDDPGAYGPLASQKTPTPPPLP